MRSSTSGRPLKRGGKFIIDARGKTGKGGKNLEAIKEFERKELNTKEKTRVL